MSSIDHFRTELRIKIGTLESEFILLAERLARGDPGSEEVARTYLERLARRIARKLPIRILAEAELNQRRAYVSRAYAAGGGELHKNSARKRALAAMEIASVALDEAAHAAVEALLTERGATELVSQI